MVLIGLLTTMAYGPTFSGEFLLDDHPLVENNPFIQTDHPLFLYFFQEDGVPDPEQWAEDYHTGYYRPLVSLSYALDYRLWGKNPSGFRATNLLLHLLTVTVLFLILTRHFPNSAAPLVAVLIFALHPVNTETVSWVSSRNNMLATLFSLLSFYFYTSPGPERYRKRRLAAILCFSIALFCKEFGLMLLPMLFFWNRLALDNERSLNREFVGYIPFVAAAGIYFLLRFSVTGAVLSPHPSARLLERIAYVPYLVMFNLKLVFMPLGLHSFSISYPPALAGCQILIGISGVLLVGLLLWHQREKPAVLFGAGAFFIGLVPVLNVIPTSAVSLISMRWLYFPFAFMAFCLSSTWLPVFEKQRKWAVGLLAGILVCLGGYTLYLNWYHWRHEAAFFQREVQLFGNLNYTGGLASILHDRGELDEARRFYLAGIASRPQMVENYIGYAALLIDTGKPATAIRVLARTRGMMLSRANKGAVFNNTAMAHVRLGELSRGRDLLERAVAYASDEPDYWANLGSAYGMTGDYTRSAAAFEQGLKLAPESVGILANLALTRIKMKDFTGAEKILDRLPATAISKRETLRRKLIEARTPVSETGR